MPYFSLESQIFNMKVVLLLGVCLCAVVLTTEAQVCKSDNDCASTHCCYIEPEFQIVSKKRQLTLGAPNHGPRDTGVCEMRLVVDQLCDVFHIMNGHCGCPTGYSCKWVPNPPLHNAGHAGRRGMIPHSEPGNYTCALD